MVRMETRGSVMLGGAVALAAAGLLRVDGVLMALGAAGGIFLAMMWVLGRWNLRRVTVELDGPGSVQAGVSVRLGLTVRNGRRWLDVFGAEVELEMPGGLAQECRVPWVAAGSAADAELRVVFPRRGAGEAAGGWLASGFPFGLFLIREHWNLARRMVVIPKPLTPVELLAGGEAWEAEPRRLAVTMGAAGDPRGLREYRSGDAVKSIAWPASVRSRARGGGVLVRELDPPGFHPRRVVVVFHSYATDGALIRPDRFERAVSLTWGTLRYFQAQGVPAVLVADFEEWLPRRVATRRQLGEAGRVLAAVERARGTELHELEGRLAEVARDDGVVVISDMDPASWEPKLARERGLVVDVTRYEGRRKRA